MNTLIASAVRHALTALAGLGGLLASKSLIDATDTAAVNAAGTTLADALAVIAAALAARLVIYLTGKLKLSSTAGLFAISPAMLGMVATAAAVGTLLPSCASVTTTTTSTAKDGSVVTVVTKSSTPDSATIQASTNAAALVLPYLIPTRAIHADK